jgi:hypothetical protein
MKPSTKVKEGANGSTNGVKKAEDEVSKLKSMDVEVEELKGSADESGGDNEDDDEVLEGSEGHDEESSEEEEEVTTTFKDLVITN